MESSNANERRRQVIEMLVTNRDVTSPPPAFYVRFYTRWLDKRAFTRDLAAIVSVIKIETDVLSW